MRSLLETEWAIYARYLARSRKPILCGPWRSEVGFEVLYWIPFLTSFREQFQIPTERLIYLGRGGSAGWFDSAGKADLFEFMPIEAVRQLTIQASQQTGSMKQHTSPAWERRVCENAATAMGIASCHQLSPSWMYRLCAPFWRGDQPVKWLDRKVLHPRRLQAAPLSPSLARALPETYIAMRWYARPTWPLREDLVLWTRKFVEAVASRIPVVLITNGFQVDDHADINLGEIGNVYKLHELQPMTPLDNLAVQSAVIQNAQGYIGTYGGMAQGAMRWGVPTLAFYRDFGQTSPAHLHLTQALSLKSGVPFIACEPQQIETLLPLIPLRKEVSA